MHKVRRQRHLARLCEIAGLFIAQQIHAPGRQRQRISRIPLRARAVDQQHAVRRKPKNTHFSILRLHAVTAAHLGRLVGDGDFLVNVFVPVKKELQAVRAARRLYLQRRNAALAAVQRDARTGRFGLHINDAADRRERNLALNHIAAPRFQFQRLREAEFVVGFNARRSGRQRLLKARAAKCVFAVDAPVGFRERRFGGDHHARRRGLQRDHRRVSGLKRDRARDKTGRGRAQLGARAEPIRAPAERDAGATE